MISPATSLRMTAAALAILSLAPVAAAARQAPSFNVKTLEGKALRSAELRNKPVIVDFWARGCGPCLASMPHLSSMQSRYEKRGLTVIGLSVDDGRPQNLRQIAGKQGGKFTSAIAKAE